MTLSRDDHQRQLQIARQELQAWTKVLDDRGVAADKREDDPRWRQFHANCLQIEARLRTVGGIEKIEAERQARKAEKASAPPEPVEKKKKGKEKPQPEKKEKKAKAKK